MDSLANLPNWLLYETFAHYKVSEDLLTDGTINKVEHYIDAARGIEDEKNLIIDEFFDSLDTCPDDENFNFCVYCRENEDCITYHTGPKCEELICFDPRGHFHGDLVDVFKAGLGVLDKDNNEELDRQEVEDFFS